MLTRCLLTVLALVLSGSFFTASAQSKPQNQPPANQPYTIQVSSRVVLTDVTVTDSKGNPIRGLPELAFRIFDNNKPQTIATFEEHTGTHAVKMEPAGVYGNDYLLRLPPVLNVVIIDIANLRITDQMYLNYELTKFFEEQPEGQPLAIYLRAGNGCFLVQNFTSDRALLLSPPLHGPSPRIPPTGREYLSDIDTLSHQIATYLSQLPGRKNILWFSGGSTLYLRDDGELYEDPAMWRNLYDELKQERIAVYPIDARGLTTYSSLSMFAQQSLMNETARATGGQAFYNNNGLTEITGHVLNSDGSFYTLTYSPHDLHFDNKWHKVRMTLNEEGYQLSYRRGYFADGSPGGAAEDDGEDAPVAGRRKGPTARDAQPSYHLPCKGAAGFGPGSRFCTETRGIYSCAASEKGKCSVLYSLFAAG